MVQPVVIFQAALLPNAAAVVASANNPSPAQVTTIIKKLTVTNTDGAAGHTFTIYIIPFGGGVAAVNLLVNARAIGLNETLDITEAINQELAPGDAVWAFADVAAKVSIRASGVQVT